MRIKGKLKSWNDDRGFGFIDPIAGGQEIFVHIKAFPPRCVRPQVDQLLWFEVEVEVGPEGKTRAKNVEFVRKNIAPSKVQIRSSSERGATTLLAIPSFVALYVFVELLWQPPLVLAVIYVVLSFVTFLAYARDKSAAQRGTRRTPEGTLHMLALVGGWPGALIAQQFLRHKSRKPEFRSAFWGTVILNVVGFVLFSSPIGQSLLSDVIRTGSSTLSK